MNCLDDLQVLDLSGWIETQISQSGQAFTIELNRCDSSTSNYCKSNAEIDQFIDSHRLYMQYN